MQIMSNSNKIETKYLNIETWAEL